MGRKGVNSYQRIFELIIESGGGQFTRGTAAPRMLTTSELVKTNYKLMKQHRELVAKTGEPQHPATQKALSAHIQEFLRRKKARTISADKSSKK